MDYALLFGVFALGVVIGVLLGAAWCSDQSIREPTESDGWPR